MDAQGFLPISLIASFHRVQALTMDINLIMEVRAALGGRSGCGAMGSDYLLSLQALKSSKEVELVDDKIRCKVDPERWPIPTPPIIGSPRTDFSQLINCPEFVPRQTLSSTNSGQRPPAHTCGLLDQSSFKYSQSL